MDTKGPHLPQRLSGADAAFLYLERKEIPLHIACVCIFEEAVPLEEFVAVIDSKLHLLPRYRQIAVSPPFDIGYPNWENDRHFDIRRHIIPLTLDAPGDEAALEDLAGRLFSQVLKRDKPLWEIYVVDGLKGGRGALIAKVHHALADGIAGASLLRIMLDATAEGSHAIGQPHVHPPAPDKKPSLTDAIASAIHSSLENLVAAEAGLLDIAEGLLSDRTQKGLQGLVTLLPEMAATVERLPFNRPCGSVRKFCWAEFDFADVKAIRTAAGGTVNDVILTVVTRALAKYVKLHGESVASRLVRLVCPVSIRKEDQGDTLGNRISFLPVSLPMDVEDPVQLLKAVAIRTEIMKSSRAAELVGIAASWLGAAPPPVQSMFWWGIPLMPLPVPLLNMICTNVPGSPTTLYSVGKRMLASYPHVPTGYELGVGCAVQSYDGKMFFGLTADAEVAGDVRLLRDFIRTSWDDLCHAAGVRKAQRPTASGRSKRAPKAKATKPAAASAPKPVRRPARKHAAPSQTESQPEPVVEAMPVAATQDGASAAFAPKPVRRPAREHAAPSQPETVAGATPAAKKPDSASAASAPKPVRRPARKHAAPSQPETVAGTTPGAKKPGGAGAPFTPQPPLEAEPVVEAMPVAATPDGAPAAFAPQLPVEAGPVAETVVVESAPPLVHAKIA